MPAHCPRESSRKKRGRPETRRQTTYAIKNVTPENKIVISVQKQTTYTIYYFWGKSIRGTRNV